MADLYDCWLPDEGQDRSDCGVIEAHDFSDAAELYAAQRCARECEWHERVVSVCKSVGGEVKKYEVFVEGRPHFYATEMAAE